MNKLQKLLATKAQLEEELEKEHQLEIQRVQAERRAIFELEYQKNLERQDAGLYQVTKEYSDVLKDFGIKDEKTSLILGLIAKSAKIPLQSFSFDVKGLKRHIEKVVDL